jgi:hypothetical protein
VAGQVEAQEISGHSSSSGWHSYSAESFPSLEPPTIIQPSYTTLGYGDLVMSPAWSLLGPLEAANGILMFGVSTATVFAVMRLIEARFADLKD